MFDLLGSKRSLNRNVSGNCFKKFHLKNFNAIICDIIMQAFLKENGKGTVVDCYLTYLIPWNH